MSAQTSGCSAATPGGHGEESNSFTRVASSNETMVMNAIMETSSDNRTKSYVTHSDMTLGYEEDLIRRSTEQPAVGGVKKVRNRKNKALSQYKAAISVIESIGKRENRTAVEDDRLSWARETVEKGRIHFENREKFAAADPNYHNKVEESLLKKLQKRKQGSGHGANNTSSNPNIKQ